MTATDSSCHSIQQIIPDLRFLKSFFWLWNSKKWIIFCSDDEKATPKASCLFFYIALPAVLDIMCLTKYPRQAVSYVCRHFEESGQDQRATQKAGSDKILTFRFLVAGP